MTRVALAAATLLLLAACHRQAASDAPDADADLRARTAAKTISDLAAADAAARAPLPQAVHAERRTMAARPEEQPEPEVDTTVPTENGAD